MSKVVQIDALLIRRKDYSVHPWRVFHGPSGDEIATFPLKRDAVAWAKSVAHFPFRRPMKEWNAEDVSKFREMLNQTPGRLLHARACERVKEIQSG